jgi:hypothetical protein
MTPELEEILKKYFIFDKVFDLFHYDSNMKELHVELSRLKQDVYKENYRFIFFFDDTQYHITDDRPGLTLLNLQRILQDLDISNYFCLILTTQNITRQLNQLRQLETTDDCNIDAITTFYSVWWLAKHIDDHIDDHIIDNDINAQNIVFKYQSLNRIKRFHRCVLFSLLRNKNLLDHGMVSYNSGKQNA